MIDSQLRTSGVNEEFVLGRMMAVPREDYLPEEKRDLAYIDRSIGLGDAGHLASPLFYGKLILEAAPSPDDTVLIVEGGTSYLTDLVAPLVNRVIKVTSDDAAKGSVPEGSFSLILVDGALEDVNSAMVASLSDDGRIVSGLLLRDVTRLAAGRKIAGSLTLQPVEDLGIPVLHAFDKPKSWTFS